MSGEQATLSAQIRFRAPKALYVVVKVGDAFNAGDITYAFPHDDSPYDYDLEANECILVYRLDETVVPLTRLLDGDAGDAPKEPT
jgi:hypothetical protein